MTNSKKKKKQKKKLNETLYTFICKNKTIKKHEFPEKTTLKEVREKIGASILQNYSFLHNNEIISRKDEKLIEIDKITDHTHNIFLLKDKSKKQLIKSNKKKKKKEKEEEDEDKDEKENEEEEDEEEKEDEEEEEDEEKKEEEEDEEKKKED